MPSWWGRSSSKEAKKKTSKESFIDTLHRKFKSPSEGKASSRSGGSQKHCSDTVSEKGSRSPLESRSPSPSKHVARCQSFAERPHAQPLPLPGVHPACVGRTNSGIGISTKPRLEKASKPSLFLPLPRPGCIRGRPNPADFDGDLVHDSVSSESSIDSDDLADSRHRSPQATDYDTGSRAAAGSPSSLKLKDQSSTVAQISSREALKPPNLSCNNHTSPTSPKRRPLGSHVPNLQVPYHGAFCSAPDSSMSSPSRSPMRAFGSDQATSSAFWVGKTYADVTLVGSGHCSSPGSGPNSGHNSMGGDMSGQLFWQQSRGSPEYSPVPSPRMTSPGPSSRIHSGAVTPTHPRAGGTLIESQTSWPDDGKQQSHRLPLPPITTSNSSPFSHSNSAATSPSVPRSPGRTENPASPGSRWKKGKLLGRGTFGHVYVAFNSLKLKDQSSTVAQISSREAIKPSNLSFIQRRFREHSNAWRIKEEELHVTCSPPASPGVKINFDVACRIGFSVLAAVCRNHEGEVLQVRTDTISISQPLWGEIKAALLACIMADEGTWPFVELEGDSLTAYTAITHNGEDLEGYLVADCRACHDFLSLHPNWKLSSIPRKRNRLGHKIAKWGGTFDLCFLVSEIEFRNLTEVVVQVTFLGREKRGE
ncbi:Mitogen-activated protein kinase kinase kinase YODA [Morella rubra]|uniref:Mitogen-activated protein kinase kinase kinase YODA n=1 Tax=Morella rubra TaxID=262757 RepID=A0A6A1UX29_9ROSI|nr:Mitogen-activated protein kinase kinase kinase YODA [Morella rubra]